MIQARRSLIIAALAITVASCNDQPTALQPAEPEFLDWAATPLFSTNLTIDATEKTSVTAATPAVLALASMADDAEVIVSVSGAGDGTATGLKLTLLGYRELA